MKPVKYEDYSALSDAIDTRQIEWLRNLERHIILETKFLSRNKHVRIEDDTLYFDYDNVEAIYDIVDHDEAIHVVEAVFRSAKMKQTWKW